MLLLLILLLIFPVSSNVTNARLNVNDNMITTGEKANEDKQTNELENKEKEIEGETERQNNSPTKDKFEQKKDPENTFSMFFKTSSTPNYVLATDADFSGTSNGNFRYIGSAEYVEIPHEIKGIKVTSYYQMFYRSNVKGVKSTNMNVKDMGFMFEDSRSSTLDLSQLNTSGVTNMRGMFYASKATEIDVTNWNTSNVTNMSRMFYGSEVTKIDLSSFNTSNVTNMSEMFAGLKVPNIDLSNFDTSNVTNMSRMFYGAKVNVLDLSNFNTSKVTNMEMMFDNLRANKLDTSSFDTRKVTNMNSMFANSELSHIDLSSFDTSNVGTMTFMFYQTKATMGHARNQTEINRLNATSFKPYTLIFYLPDTPIITFSANGSSAYRPSHSTTIDVKIGKSYLTSLQYSWSTSPTYVSDWTDIPNGQTITRSGVNGNYYLHVRALSSTKSDYKVTNAFRFDNTIPTLSLSYSPTSYTNDQVIITATGSDTYSGVRRIRLAGGSWSNGSTMTYAATENGTYHFEIEDHAGNTNTKSITISNIEKTKPNVMLLKNGGDWAHSHSTSINVTDIGSGVNTIQYRFTTSSSFPTSDFTTVSNGASVTTPATTGEYYLHVRATDHAGNVTQYTSNAFKVDRSEPIVSLSPNGGTWSQSHTTKLDVTDNESGVSTVEYRFTTSRSFPSSGFTAITNGSIVNVPTSTGEHYLHVRATDNLGNVRKFTSNAFYIDLIKPTVPSISAPTAWTHNDANVVITAGADHDSGVARTEYRLNGESWTTYDQAVTIAKNGETSVEARTVDHAGNVSDIVSTIVKVDKVKPTLSINLSTTNVTHEDITLTATASDEHSGVKRMMLPDNTWVNGSSATFSAKYNGTYEFVVEDYAGNTHTESITITNIDKTISFEKPSISNIDNVTLGESKRTVTANVTPMFIKDWRDTSNDWRLLVSATRAKLKGEEYYLPVGTMELKAISDVERITGSGSIPTTKLTTKTAIDNGQVAIAESTDSRGEYRVIFPSNALEISVDPTTAKAGTYTSTITWELVTAP